MARNQGEAASSRTARLAKPREARRVRRAWAARTDSAARRGLTSHGAPTATPRASTAGQPGGKIENHLPPSTVMKSYCSALTASAGGAGAQRNPWA